MHIFILTDNYNEINVLYSLHSSEKINVLLYKNFPNPYTVQKKKNFIVIKIIINPGK